MMVTGHPSGADCKATLSGVAEVGASGGGEEAGRPGSEKAGRQLVEPLPAYDAMREVVARRHPFAQVGGADGTDAELTPKPGMCFPGKGRS